MLVREYSAHLRISSIYKSFLWAVIKCVSTSVRLLEFQYGDMIFTILVFAGNSDRIAAPNSILYFRHAICRTTFLTSKLTVAKGEANLGFTAQTFIKKRKDFIVDFYDKEIYALVPGIIGKELGDIGVKALSIDGHLVT